MPTVRAIARSAETQGNRMSAYILGVVQSPAFQMNELEVVTDQEDMQP